MRASARLQLSLVLRTCTHERVRHHRVRHGRLRRPDHVLRGRPDRGVPPTRGAEPTELLQLEKPTAPDSVLAQRDRANKQTDKTGNALQCIYADFHRHRERCLKAREEPAHAYTWATNRAHGVSMSRRCLTRMHLRVLYL